MAPSHAARCARLLPRPAVSDGRSCAAGKSSLTASSVATRHTAVTPLSVANAAMPSTSNTTSDFRLPPPARTSDFDPQPEANTMPMPNISPPTVCEAQASDGAA